MEQPLSVIKRINNMLIKYLRLRHSFDIWPSIGVELCTRGDYGDVTSQHYLATDFHTFLCIRLGMSLEKLGSGHYIFNVYLPQITMTFIRYPCSDFHQKRNLEFDF